MSVYRTLNAIRREVILRNMLLHLYDRNVSKACVCTAGVRNAVLLFFVLSILLDLSSRFLSQSSRQLSKSRTLNLRSAPQSPPTLLCRLGRFTHLSIRVAGRGTQKRMQHLLFQPLANQLVQRDRLAVSARSGASIQRPHRH